MQQPITITFLITLLWTLLIASCLNITQGETFSFSEYELEKSKWKSPHDDVFNIDREEEKFEWSDLAVDAGGTLECDKLHAAFKACQSTVSIVSGRVEKAEARVRQLIQHLLRSIKRLPNEEDGGYLIKISNANIRLLESFAKDGKLSSTSHSTVYDLLKEIINVPPPSFMENTLSLVERIVYPITWFCEKLVFVVNIFNLRRAEFQDIVNYGFVFLPLATFGFCIFRGRSVKRSIAWSFFVIIGMGYIMESRQAIKDAEAKNFAKLVRQTNLPPECDPASMTYMQSFWSFFKREDPCEAYFRDQNSEPVIQAQHILWKNVFSVLEVAMGSIGSGLANFMGSFSKNLGFLDRIYMIPIGIIALVPIMALVAMVLLGGTYDSPFLGRFSFRSSPVARMDRSSPSSPSSCLQPPGAQSIQAGRNVITHNHYYGGASQAPLLLENQRFLTASSNGANAIVMFDGPETNVARAPSSRVLISRNNTNLLVQPLPETALSSTSASREVGGSLRESGGNSSGSAKRTEVGSGDVAPTQKLHRMLSSGAALHREGLRHRHVRKNSLPNNFLFWESECEQ